MVQPVEGAGFYLYRVTANQRPCGVRREVKKGTRSPLPFCYSRFLSPSPPLALRLLLFLARHVSPRRGPLRKLVNEPLVFAERS